MKKKIVWLLCVCTCMPQYLLSHHRSIPLDMLGYVILESINYKNLEQISYATLLDTTTLTNFLNATNNLTKGATGEQQYRTSLIPAQTKLPNTTEAKDQNVVGSLTIGSLSSSDGGKLTLRATTTPAIHLVSGDDPAWVIASLGDTNKKLVLYNQSTGTQTTLTPLGVFTVPTAHVTSELQVTGNTNITGPITITGTLGITGNTTIDGTLGVSGATTLHNTLGVTGNVAINTDKFNITAANGNTTIAGTLGVAGASTLNSLGVTNNTAIGGNLNLSGDLTINTDKYHIAAASGNTTIAGTLNVANTIRVATDRLIVDGPTGNITTAGTITVPAQGQILVAGETLLHEAYNDSTIFVGRRSGNRTLTGIDNTGCGIRSLEALTSGTKNTGIGARALKTISIGEGNCAIGSDALAEITSGTGNVGMGRSTLAQLTEGANNTAIGFQAGQNLTNTSSNNIYIGANQTGPSGSEENTTRIGVPLQTAQCFVGGIYDQSSTEAPIKLVSIDSAGKLVTNATATTTSNALTVGGDFAVGSNTVQVTAATGSTSIAGHLTLTALSETHPELHIRGGNGNTGPQLYAKPVGTNDAANLAFNASYNDSRSNTGYSQSRLSLLGNTKGSMILSTSPNATGGALQETLRADDTGISLSNIIINNAPTPERTTGKVPFAEGTFATSLRIIYGSINADGTIVTNSSSAGFTASFVETIAEGDPTGYYKITFTKPFTYPPCVTIGSYIDGNTNVTPITGFSAPITQSLANDGTLTTTGFRVVCLTVGVAWQKRPWHFIAIGM